MTLRSRKKLPITRENTPSETPRAGQKAATRRTTRKVLAGLSLLAGLGLVSAELNAAEPGRTMSGSLRKLFDRNASQRANDALKQSPGSKTITRPAVRSALINGGAPPLPAEPLPVEAQPLEAQPAVNQFVLPEPAVQRHVLPVSGLQGSADVVESSYQNTTTDPRSLKKITTIEPFADYRPELKVESKIDPSLVAPEEVELGDIPVQPRANEPVLYQWQAANAYHYPLYFEDPSLERYGHTYHPLFQPFASMGRFGVQAVGLPYQMTIDPMWKRQYTLGWYRPGECAPKRYPTIPWNTKAAINQAAVVTGGVFALP